MFPLTCGLARNDNLNIEFNPNGYFYIREAAIIISMTKIKPLGIFFSICLWGRVNFFKKGKLFFSYNEGVEICLSFMLNFSASKWAVVVIDQILVEAPKYHI